MQSDSHLFFDPLKMWTS